MVKKKKSFMDVKSAIDKTNKKSLTLHNLMW